MNYKEKISTLSTIPIKSIDLLNDYIMSVHSHELVTGVIENNNSFELDIFEGKLIVYMVDDQIKYKFIPSNDFISMTIDALTSKKSRLIDISVDKLKKSFTKTYKDIF